MRALDIQVAFQTMNQEMLFAEAVVFSNDAEESSIPVALVGQGAAPNLLITPDSIELWCDLCGL